MPIDDKKPLSRAERRRILREQKKGANKSNETNSVVPAGGQAGQRKLVVSFALFLAASFVFSLAKGGKLWIDLPVWLTLVGWGGVAGIGLVGFHLWRKNRKSFKFGLKWAWWLAVALALGLTLGYYYSESIRGVGDFMGMKSIKRENERVISQTSTWKSESWDAARCSEFEKGQRKLHDDVMKGPFPPTRNSYSLLLSVSQVGYQAGCKVDFESQASQLLDKDGKWQKAAPLLYRFFRDWINREGWPRLAVGCQWEANRARIDGNEELYTHIEKLCHPASLRKLEPWSPGYFTDLGRATLLVEEASKDDAQETIRLLEQRADTKTKKEGGP